MVDEEEEGFTNNNKTIFKQKYHHPDIPRNIGSYPSNNNNNNICYYSAIPTKTEDFTTTTTAAAAGVAIQPLIMILLWIPFIDFGVFFMAYISHRSYLGCTIHNTLVCLILLYSLCD